MSRDKTLVVISDGHSGHQAGLTPPEYANSITGEHHRRDKFAVIQDVTWRWYYQEAVRLRPVDILVYNGDAIDGRGEKSGSTELIAADRTVQCTMAVESIMAFQPKNVVITLGTDYHVASTGEEWEYVIAKLLKDRVEGDVAIGAHEWFTVNGVMFDCKHHLGSSGVPNTKFNAIAKDALWNMVYASRKEAPRADVIVRSHVHSFCHCGDTDFFACSTPGLQAYSKFGAKRVSRTIDYGFMHFDVSKEGNYQWHPHIAKFKECRPSVLRY